jgi:hypothetical protein
LWYAGGFSPTDEKPWIGEFAVWREAEIDPPIKKVDFYG